MKRWVHATSIYNDNTDLLEISVDIRYDLVRLDSSSILNLDDPEFNDFVLGTDTIYIGGRNRVLNG